MFRTLTPKEKEDLERRATEIYGRPMQVVEEIPPSPPPSREELEAMMLQVVRENPDMAVVGSNNGQRIREFLEEHTDGNQQPLWCLENLRTAVAQLRLRGQLELKPPPAPPPPVVVEPVAPAEEPLPEIPSYMGKIDTKADVLACTRYKEFFFGKHKERFRARVDEILRRAALAGE